MSADLSTETKTSGQKAAESADKGAKWDKSGGSSPAGNKKIVVAGIVILLILILMWVANLGKRGEDPNVVEFSGRIEAPETYITAGVNTKVQSVNVREGQHVSRGQHLLALDSQILKVKQRAIGSEENLARQAQSQAGTQVQMAQTHVDQARKKSKGFFAKIFGSKKKKAEETARLTEEMKSAQMQLFQAKAAIIKTQAAKGEISSKQSFFNLTSPLDGICVTRSVEPGEVVSAGQILLSIINPAAIYMKGFIPEGSLSRIKIGQEVEILLDKADHPLIGHITAIDTEPSFTPQNIYFKDDRVKQVYGIKIAIDKPDGTAKPGMPADARIDLRKKDN